MITIPRADLVAALEAVKGCVATKTFQPILTHVLIDRNTVMAFDSEVGVKVKLPVDCGATFNVRFDTLYNLVKALDGDQVTFVIEGQKVRLNCGQHRSTLVCIEDKFPTPNESTTGEPSAVPTGFKEALERAVMSASKAETERVMSSVLVRQSNVMATDRKSAVRCTLDPMAPLPTMLLSRKAVTELIRLGQPGTVRVDGAWSIWDYGNLTFIAALREGEGEFPPLWDLMTKLNLPPLEEMNAIPDGFAAILSRLGLFCGDKGMVSTRPTAMALELTARSETGDIVEYIDGIEGVPAGKGFDPKVLHDALSFATKMFWGRTNLDPIVLRGTDANFEFILSPMRGV